MSKDKIQLLSPLFLKYQADFEKNPRSRVFAPLAETYRKLGMTDKAMEILSQGIRFHPTYVMGYLGLSFCYYDLKQFSLAYSTLRPLVETSRDNIRLQKLFADICIELGYKEEALDTYKYLLFINPRDKEVALHVSTLERSIEEQYKPVHQPIYIPESEFKSDYKTSMRAETSTQQLFDIDKLENRPNSSTTDFDDWMALDLSRDQKPAKSEDPYEFWNLKKGDVPLDLKETKPKQEIVQEPTPLFEEPKVTHHQESVIQPYVELDFNDEEETPDSAVNETPLVTHTLVDLYCGQGHIEKALEVLEKILILNPKDEKTIKKISEIKSLMGHYEQEDQYREEKVEEEKQTTSSEPTPRPHLEILQDVSEEDGRKNLMSIFDQQIKHVEVEEVKEKTPAPKIAAPQAKPQVQPQPKSDKNRLVEEKLSQFLKKIQKRALDYQARS